MKAASPPHRLSQLDPEKAKGNTVPAILEVMKRRIRKLLFGHLILTLALLLGVRHGDARGDGV